MDRATMHEQNKREAFDGMRAYHQSEILHKGQSVEVIKTLLTLVVAAYGGLIILILKAELSRCQGSSAAIIFLFCVVTAVYFVVRETNQKVDADHASYEDHRAEYMASRHALGIDSTFEEGYQTHWKPREKWSASGYLKTKQLNRVLGWIVVGTAAAGTILAILSSSTRALPGLVDPGLF